MCHIFWLIFSPLQCLLFIVLFLFISLFALCFFPCFCHYSFFPVLSLLPHVHFLYLPFPHFVFSPPSLRSLYVFSAKCSVLTCTLVAGRPYSLFTFLLLLSLFPCYSLRDFNISSFILRHHHQVQGRRIRSALNLSTWIRNPY